MFTKQERLDLLKDVSLTVALSEALNIKEKEDNTYYNVLTNPLFSKQSNLQLIESEIQLEESRLVDMFKNSNLVHYTKVLIGQLTSFSDKWEVNFPSRQYNARMLEKIRVISQQSDEILAMNKEKLDRARDIDLKKDPHKRFEVEQALRQYEETYITRAKLRTHMNILQNKYNKNEIVENITIADWLSYFVKYIVSLSKLSLITITSVLSILSLPAIGITNALEQTVKNDLWGKDIAEYLINFNETLMKTISSYVEGLTGAGPIIQTGILWASTIFISIYLVAKMVKVVKIYLTERVTSKQLKMSEETTELMKNGQRYQAIAKVLKYKIKERNEKDIEDILKKKVYENVI